MKPRFELHALAKPKVWEHLVRFAFGGIVSVAASLVAHKWGPRVGGLFLAFPAILPASLTLVKQHGGRAQAVDDARGARLGALALLAFSGIVLGLQKQNPALVLGTATFAWLGVAFGLWWLTYRRSSL